MDRVAASNPEKILEVMARVLPKEVAVSVEQRGPMDSETVRKLRRIVDLIDACGAGGVAEETVLAWIEEDLRARMAVPVEGKGTGMSPFDPDVWTGCVSQERLCVGCGSR